MDSLEILKLATTVVMVVATVINAIQAWGFKSGRWSQRAEDAPVALRETKAEILHEVGVLRTYIVDQVEDLKAGLTEEHRRRQGADTTIATNVSDLATRVTRIEERADEKRRRLELLERWRDKMQQ